MQNIPANGRLIIDNMVIRLKDQALTQISEGSKAMTDVHTIFDIFYMKSYDAWAKLCKLQ